MSDVEPPVNGVSGVNGVNGIDKVGYVLNTAARTVDPIFPGELKARVAAELELPGPRATWYR